MLTKKPYKAPEIHSEEVAIGVFGDYSSSDDSGGCDLNPLSFFLSYFHVWCCK